MNGVGVVAAMQMVTPLNQLFHCCQGVTTVWELFRAVMRNTINEDLAQAGYAAVLESFEVVLWQESASECSEKLCGEPERGTRY